MTALLDWLAAYLCRWLARSTPTGLTPVGNPDADSPVLVTANFALTVRRVRRALRGRDLWLLVVNTGGINVWCAAAGGLFTHDRVVDAVKVSGLGDRVRHRRLILPALAAAGIDRQALREATGFGARFGPVYARDIPAYLEAGCKTERMRRFDFGAAHRLDMFVPMNLPIYLLLAVPVAFLGRPHLPGFTILFWSAVAFLYVFVDWIPGASGWGQAARCAAVVGLAAAGLDWLRRGDPLAHWGWLLTTIAIFLAAGFDLAGTVSARRSDAELLLHRLGFKRLGALFSDKQLGRVGLDRDRCSGCRTCYDLCPVGVYGDLDGDGRTTLRDPAACFACGACVRQCPAGALSLSRAG